MCFRLLFIAILAGCLPLGGAFAQSLDITTLGAVGNGSRLNTVEIQAAIDSCATGACDTVLIPSGTFRTATLRLQNGTHLHLADGAVLQGSPNLTDYPRIDAAEPSIADEYSRRALLFAQGVRDVSITGRGTIDGNGTTLTWATANANDRPFGLRFLSCRNVRIEGVRLRNSGFWMMIHQNIDSLVIRNVDIYNHAFGNNDGLSVDACRDVLIEGCTVDANNDPLVLKGMLLARCARVEVRNCTLATWSRAIKIGTETTGDFDSIWIHDIMVRKSSFLNRLADGGIVLASVDGSNIRNVRIERVQISGVRVPITVRLGNRGRSYVSGYTPPIGSFENLLIQDVEIDVTDPTNNSTVVSTLTGIPSRSLRNVTLRRVLVKIPGGGTAPPDGFTVPEDDAARPNPDVLGNTYPCYGIYVRHVENLTLDSVCFELQRPDPRPLYYFENTPGLDTTPFCEPVVLGGTSRTPLVNGTLPIIFPNPAIGGTVTLHWPDANWAQNAAPVTLTLTNSVGQVIISQTITAERTQLELSNLPAGLYFLQLEQSGTRHTLRLLRN